jgi:hypothetical protein
MGEISLSILISGFRVGDGVASGVVTSFFIDGIGGAGLWACVQPVSYRSGLLRDDGFLTLGVSRLPEERGRWKGEINKYLQDVEARATLAASVKR